MKPIRIEATTMDFAKSLLPYGVLFLADSYYMHLQVESYLIVCLLLVYMQITRWLAGYDQGFGVAERVGMTILMHLTDELGPATISAAMSKMEAKVKKED